MFGGQTKTRAQILMTFYALRLCIDFPSWYFCVVASAIELSTSLRRTRLFVHSSQGIAISLLNLFFFFSPLHFAVGIRAGKLKLEKHGMSRQCAISNSVFNVTFFFLLFLKMSLGNNVDSYCKGWESCNNIKALERGRIWVGDYVPVAITFKVETSTRHTTEFKQKSIILTR